MKLWIYFNETLKKQLKNLSDGENEQEGTQQDEIALQEDMLDIADIQFSYCTSPKYQTIFKMQEFQIELEYIE
jgi:hypothetical protein